MQTQLLNIVLAFLEGFALIISPCILPILPLILSGSIEGGKRRPIGITLGFVICFAVFTLFSRKLVQYSGIDLNLVRYISYILLIIFGVIMLSTSLTEKFSRLTQRFARAGSTLSSVNDPQGGLMSGLLFGGLVALIWTPCAGPILAAVIVQTVMQKTTLNSYLTVLAFGIGAGVPMLLISLFGRTLLNKFNFLKSRTELLRKTLGAIIIFSVGFMIYNEAYSTSTSTVTSSNPSSQQSSLINGLFSPFAAPPIEGIAAWINSPPLTIEQLKGKVVLIDFWTYSCINCVRTLPYLKDWYQKYHDRGFVIIGVHTPEFEFEKDLANVKRGVEKYGIKYPVALDNNFVTWQNYNNQYWPAHYLIDKSGNVVYTHFGEGEYDVTENNIRFLLGMNKPTTPAPAENLPGLFSSQTPETYFGYARADRNYSPESVKKNQVAQYSFPQTLSKDGWALNGKWIVAAQYITSAEKDAAVKLHFNAKNVYAVLGNATKKPIEVKLRLNGEAVINEKGKDVMNSSVTVTSHALYELISLPQSGKGIIELIVSDPGLEVYTFTFG